MYRALLRLCLLASSLIVALPLFAAAPDAPAFGVIVGYRDAVNPLSREETDRGPWADGRARHTDVLIRMFRQGERSGDWAASAYRPNPGRNVAEPFAA